MSQFDVVIVGGGHAGVEAACAAARMGAETALVTMDARTIGAMSCNPAIGGLGKGHLVREVDALDGVIARAADAAAIHYRMLNASKGRAVQGPRVQADRARFAAAVQAAVATTPRLRVIEADVVALRIDDGRIAGVDLADGSTIAARAVVLATGTFLGGRLFRGAERGEGGRVHERAAGPLGRQLRALGLPVGRLKTGTPPRLDGRTIDWSALERQPSDEGSWTMSARGRRVLPPLACFITRTTPAAHDAIRAGLATSPLYGGAIAGEGPRYCPSVEDKIVRFGDRDGHQIFLEPEGLDTHSIYPNGISTSLATEVQMAMLRAIPGLARAEMIEPGYAVEYDYVDPRCCDHRLAVRAVTGLFHAGQINGTTGYEEAAAQGLLAGLNAAAHALDREGVTIARDRAYMGVMVDDLVLQGVTEPYRMLTARAEARLALRADNAATRLTPLGIAAGCVGVERQESWASRERALANGHAVATKGDDAATLLAKGIDASVVDEISDDLAYAPYIARQQAEAAAIARGEAIRIPHGFAYAAVPGLSNEMVDRLSKAEPATIADAGRVQGITPAAIAAVYVAVKRTA